MSTKFRRGAIATLAAGALALSFAPSALADVIDPDNPYVDPPEASAGEAELYRIADSDRITTAIKASQSGRWGDIQYQDWQRWVCAGDSRGLLNVYEGRLTLQPAGTTITVDAFDVERFEWVEIDCVAEYAFTASAGNLDVIVATADEYADALAAAPLADVLDAPILLTGGDSLDPRTRAEIARLAGEAGGRSNVTVHVLGGTDALSHSVENAIDAIPNVDTTLRYQGIDRYETAVNIAGVTVGWYGVDSGASLFDINTYLTTGINFPDALTAGAAAAENDGVVLLTRGTEMDRRGFTEQFLINLRDWVADEVFANTTENFAVGGPSAQAAEDYDIRVAASYVGRNRYETATMTARGTFGDPEFIALASGENYPDGLVGGAFAANADGPLLLTNDYKLNEYAASYLMDYVDDGDTIVVFGGGNSVSPVVSQQVQELLDELFELPEW